MTVRIGSCFAGIGGWELGLERAIPNSHTIWQVEQNTFCQSILKKHWPNATIFDDVHTVGAHNLQPIDLLCAGFPCQDLSLAGNQRGIHDGEKSSLYWELHRIICELRPRIICLENVANIIRLGGTDVVGSLAKIGYDCEWTIIRSGADFGLPHIRKRWFCVAYPTGFRQQGQGKHRHPKYPKKNTNWQTGGIISAIQSNALPYVCRTHHGLSTRLARQMMKALGNAIVPQASEWIGRQIVQSGLIDDLID